MKLRPYSSSVLAPGRGASIGWMAAVNFFINLDFKWLILAIALVWVIALTFYRMERNKQ